MGVIETWEKGGRKGGRKFLLSFAFSLAADGRVILAGRTIPVSNTYHHRLARAGAGRACDL